ncbi:hypothetical protein QMN03_13850, partial [Leptospira santarosai]|nr:hypothetical protein [Leptospira santarosai]
PKGRSIGRVWKLSETLPELSISLPKGRSIGRVWKLSETLPMGRVSGFDISFELSENRRT